MPVKERLAYLLNQYFNGTSSSAERTELLQLVYEKQHDIELKALMDQYWEKVSDKHVLGEEKTEQIISYILESERVEEEIPAIGRRKTIFPFVRVAAAVLILLSAGYYFFVSNKQGEVPAVSQTVTDLPPGKNAAVLTLANGKKLILDSASGTVSSSGGINVINRNGLLSYEGESEDVALAYNTITTGRGNQYQLQLEDGTNVWLNAASSLHYPVAFNGKERVVELTGEGYFEVAKDLKKPFRVKVGETMVEVLGTHFNINAYPDEGVLKTTLLEGAVKVVQPDNEKILKPGEQAQIKTGAGIAIKAGVDVDAVVAWKNGLFLLDNTDLPTILRQISRWYDVDIEYAGAIPASRFEGGVSKNLPLSKVLQLLEANGINIRLQGKKLVVEPGTP